MTTAGITLGADFISGLKDLATGMTTSIVNVLPVIILAGLSIYAVMWLFRKVPSFFKRLTR